MRSPPSRRSIGVTGSCLAALALAACATPDPLGETGAGGTSATGQAGSTGGGETAGTSGTAGTTGTGGTLGTAGVVGTAGTTGRGGTTGYAGTTGSAGRGGTTGVAGTTGSAGRGGTTGSAGTTGGGGRGGATGAAGTTGSSGTTGTGGTTGSGGTAGTGAASDPCLNTTPLTGGTEHKSANDSKALSGFPNVNWTIWSNGAAGSITTYDKLAFKATWNNSGDFLARLGLQWNATKTYDQYGTITAQFSSKKTGSGGQYSYIGVYGWSVSPCVEFYIVDDSYNNLPVNPGNTSNKGTATIDGGTYTLYTRATSGTGGSKCPGTSNWQQYYSIRQKARQCGQISITEHFKAWAAAGMTLGKMDQAQLLVEVGGGSGSIDFTVADISATNP